MLWKLDQIRVWYKKKPLLILKRHIKSRKTWSWRELIPTFFKFFLIFLKPLKNIYHCKRGDYFKLQFSKYRYIYIYIMGSCLCSSHPEVVFVTFGYKFNCQKVKGNYDTNSALDQAAVCMLELLAEKKGPTTQHVLPFIFLLNSYRPSFTIFTVHM